MSFEDADFAEARALVEEGHGTIEDCPTKEQKLGRYTIVALSLNRTIGSAIFVAPALVLKGTGSVVASLLLWILGALIGTSGLLLWLQFCLSVPRARPNGERDGDKRPVPRSGGEKNILEYILKREGRHRLASCIYGIPYILLGNLSANAIAFGRYCMVAAGDSDPARGPVYGIAIGALTFACLIHVASRRGGILLNNFYAAVKVLILVVIITLGFMRSRGFTFGGRADPTTYPTGNFDINTSSDGSTTRNLGDFAYSLLFTFNAFGGFKQPFYVLSEVRQPRRRFPKYSLIAMAITVTLFLLVNVAFLCAVPKAQQMSSNLDMATLFFQNIFGKGGASRTMAGVIAFSIFGNLVVMTFAASRVKQEIAKEGILPYSLFFARGHATFIARIWSRYATNPPQHLEQTPIPAMFLHWLSSITLIAAISALKPMAAYTVLASLYAYTMNALVGLVVAGGLLYLYLTPSRRWDAKLNFRPFGKKLKFPIHALFHLLACIFVLIATFAPPSISSPFWSSTWYVVPTVGISAPMWGLVWWAGIKVRSKSTARELVVHRVPNVEEDEEDPGRYILLSEVVDHAWEVPEKPRGG